MNSKTTGIWFVIAASLAAFIFVFQHWLRPAGGEQSAILPGFQPAAVTSVQVIPPDAPEIRADLTNGVWRLTKPVVYPAQAAAIETLLGTLQQLRPETRISAAELRANQGSEGDFGFGSPTSLVIESGGRRWQLQIGHKTAPGTEVYLRSVRVDGTFVTDAGWLNLVPHSADDWRDSALVDAGRSFDQIVLTNGAKGLAIELRRDPTNHLWRMIRPLQARADTSHIDDALQRLQSARVTKFIPADAKTDPAAFGFQPAALDLWLGSGTNVSAIHVGKSPTNDPSQVYARREGWNTILATAAEPLSPWFGSVNSFRDRNLLELTAPVAEIELTGPDTNHFTLQRQGTNDWKIPGETFAVDAANVQLFIKTLAGLHISDFVRDVVTAPDLPKYGLAAPEREIILRSKAGDTNAVIADLMFGVTTNGVFVRRAGEDSIYSITKEDFNRLPEADWEYRDRHVWSFDTNDVAQVTVRQNGRMRQLVRNGPGQWTLAAASGPQSITADHTIEQAVGQLSHLTAEAWVGRNVTDPQNYGFNTNSLQIAIEMKNGRKHTVDFGLPIFNGNSALAATTLDGERWVFVFPVVPYQYVLTSLTIPANPP
jgi:hypothetical protein